MPQRAIRAEYMRGGTSKGVFFRSEDLPADPAVRDAILLRVIGSPDQFGKQIDGMGGAVSSTSKVVIVQRSVRADCDVEFLFGQVAIDRPLIDYSGNCGNLTTAVGPFALWQGLIPPVEGTTTVRIWQANIGRRIVAHVPVADGVPIEAGDFIMDGVPFPAAEIVLEFLDAGGSDEGVLLPTGRIVDRLEVPGHGTYDVSLVNAGSQVAFITAEALGLTGSELPREVNANAKLLERVEAIRVAAAVAMKLAPDAATATRTRPATPRLSFVAPARDFVTTSGKEIAADQFDILARIVSMGQLHRAYIGTGAVAIGVAAALPGSIVANAARARPVSGPQQSRNAVPTLRVGHAAGVMRVGADVCAEGDDFKVDCVVVSRSARRLMSGKVFVTA